MAASKTFRTNQSDTGSSGTTLASDPDFDSTGAKAVVVWCSHEGAPTTITVTDSKGNTYTALTKVNHGNGDISSQMFYVLNPTVGTAHEVTMTVAASRAWKELTVWTATADTTLSLATSVQNSGASGVPKNAGNLVVSHTNSVSFMGATQYTEESHTITGWTEDVDNVGFAASRVDTSSGTFSATTSGNAGADWTANALTLGEGSAGSSILRQMMAHHE